MAALSMIFWAAAIILAVKFGLLRGICLFSGKITLNGNNCPGRWIYVTVFFNRIDLAGRALRSSHEAPTNSLLVVADPRLWREEKLHGEIRLLK